MINVFFRVVFSVMAVLGLGSTSPVFGITGDTVVSEIQKRYDSTADLEASFVQEYVGQVVRVPQKGEGQVSFKKKGMMRWDYRVPNQKLISNGKTLWFYQPEDHQVFVSDLSKVLRERTPLAFLAGEGNLTRDFTLGKFNEAVSPTGETYVLELIPKEPNQVLAKLILTVDKKTFYVVQTDVIDGLSNVTRTRFTNIRTNRSLPDSLFNFVIPPGTEILKAQEVPSP